MGRLQLSPNFYADEFTRSETAARLGIDVEIIPGTPVYRAVLRLVDTVLQPVREGLGPVLVSSGYRPPDLNAAIGGSKTSQHMKGEAADISVVGCTPLEVCQWIKEQGLPFDQLIHELGRWTHVSIAMSGEPRGETLTAYFDKNAGYTRYVPGLIAIEDLVA